MRKIFATHAIRARLPATRSRWLLAIAFAMLLGHISGPFPGQAAEFLNLQIQRQGQVLRLTAPLGATNLMLESSSNLLASGWTLAPESFNGSNSLVLPDFAGRARFFRLRGEAFNLLPETNSTPAMVLIPAGAFQMGDALNDGLYDEVPVHTLYISAFYIEKFSVRKDLWDSVYAWALSHGYTFDNPGLAKAANHPVQAVNWYDVVKWCNARSEKELLTPMYYTTVAQSAIYRSGRIDLEAGFVKWTANGYRLPTEAEWEKAARGGVSGQRFPWGNLISQSRANYFSTGIESYDVTLTRGCNPAWLIGLEPYTSPAGSFAPNAYGLNDMAGNVFQWCWDWAQDDWYRQPLALQPDTKGPASGHDRIFRGGGWDYEADRQRCSRRSRDGPIAARDWEALGFRCVRGVIP